MQKKLNVMMPNQSKALAAPAAAASRRQRSGGRQQQQHAELLAPRKVTSVSQAARWPGHQIRRLAQHPALRHNVQAPAAAPARRTTAPCLRTSGGVGDVGWLAELDQFACQPYGKIICLEGGKAGWARGCNCRAEQRCRGQQDPDCVRSFASQSAIGPLAEGKAWPRGPLPGNLSPVSPNDDHCARFARQQWKAKGQ